MQLYEHILNHIYKITKFINKYINYKVCTIFTSILIYFFSIHTSILIFKWFFITNVILFFRYFKSFKELSSDCEVKGKFIVIYQY